MAENRTITAEFEAMRIGECKEFPAASSLSVRSMASSLGFKWNRKYKTKTDRERRVMVVTRVS